MAHDVFISYSSADKPLADRVCHALEEKGLRCWIAPRDIPFGAEWPQAIMGAIGGAKAMVLVFTHNTNGSAHVRREVAAALEAGAIVIPFRTDETKAEGALHYNLINLHWMDATSPPLEAHIDGLIATLTRLEGEAEGGTARAPPPSSPMAEPVLAMAGAPASAAVAAVAWTPTPDRRLEIVFPICAIISALGFFTAVMILSLAITIPLVWRASYTMSSPDRRASRRLRLLASFALVVIAIAAIAIGGRYQTI
ncbi:MAG: toll/interleukin-1 receptor domain-containing protein [Caulobacteraceae bacterium]